jgi:CRISPR system Cascade subunit CasB
MTEVDASRTQWQAVTDVVAWIGHTRFGTGPLAELRRIDPKQAAWGQPALHRLLAHYVPEEWLRGDGMSRWALLIHLLALAAPDHNRGGRSLGRALFAADYSEGRLTRLLEASAEDFADVLPRMVRFLVAKGERFDPHELADLVLWRGTERGRMRIAQEYYRAETSNSQAV